MTTPNLSAVRKAIEGARAHGLKGRLVARIHTDDAPAFRAELGALLEAGPSYPCEPVVGPIAIIDGVPLLASAFHERGVVDVREDASHPAK